MPHLASHPLVSVVMPVYNQSDFLAEAIDSILVQTYPHFELILVDDGSTDGSQAVISAYGERDRRIRPLFRNHRGVARGDAMREGVLHARGEWIARMDHDDVALPERLARCLHWAERNRLDVCGGQAETFGDEETRFWFPEGHEAIRRELLFRCPLLYPATMIRTEVLRANLAGSDCVFDDYELFSRLALGYRLGNTPELVLRYRRHATQTSLVRRAELVQDFQNYRFRYFFQTYPTCPLSVYLPLARVSDRLPTRSLEELKRAGQWLSELADSPDPMLRRRMAQRWQATRERSAALGEAVEAIFRQFPRLTEIDQGVTALTTLYAA